MLENNWWFYTACSPNAFNLIAWCSLVLSFKYVEKRNWLVHRKHKAQSWALWNPENSLVRLHSIQTRAVCCMILQYVTSLSHRNTTFSPKTHRLLLSALAFSIWVHSVTSPARPEKGFIAEAASDLDTRLPHNLTRSIYRTHTSGSVLPKAHTTGK